LISVGFIKDISMGYVEVDLAKDDKERILEFCVIYHSCVSGSYSPYNWPIVTAFGFITYVMAGLNGLPFGCN